MKLIQKHNYLIELNYVKTFQKHFFGLFQNKISNLELKKKIFLYSDLLDYLMMEKRENKII